MNSKYKINKKKNLYDGFFQLNEINFNHKKHNGEWNNNVSREVFGGAHVSTVLPYDPVKKKILLLKQFRAGVIERGNDPIITEIVAGIIDKGENPKQAAVRECKEETGCEVNKIIEIFPYYPAPGSSESYYHLFLGEINAFEGERIMGQEHENEDILVKSYDVEEVKNLLDKQKILNGLTIIALQWFFLKYYKT
jgi:ADP-ribose pyrophosphatase|tara:strand:+ start:19 stop:600 length:582 start_codon:yes stop_codon:yes gene_type:complete